MQQLVNCSSCQCDLCGALVVVSEPPGVLDLPLILINNSITMIISIALIWAVVVGFCCLLWLAVGIRRR